MNNQIFKVKCREPVGREAARCCVLALSHTDTPTHSHTHTLTHRHTHTPKAIKSTAIDTGQAVRHAAGMHVDPAMVPL